MRTTLLPALLLAACGPSDINVTSLKPDITVLPAALDFGEVVVDETASLSFTVKNAGRNDLEISGASVAGADGVWSWDLEAVTLAPDEDVPVEVSFAPNALQDFADTLSIASNDPEDPTMDVLLAGTGRAAPVPDIAVDSTSLDFGDVAPGDQGLALLRLSNEGELDLTISYVAVEGPGVFTLSDDLNGEVLSPGNPATAFVYYDPLDDSGDSGSLIIYSDDPDENPLEIELIGNGGGDLDYPVAVVDCPTGVEPRSTVTLDASASYDPEEMVPLTYSWTLTNTPDGSEATLSSAESLAELYVDLAGEYTVSVVATNAVGVSSAPARCNLDVVPAADVHVELVWDTENSDLDLHLADGEAALYDVPGDVSPCNKTPDWGTAGETLDDPSLDLRDEDGYGPESIGIDEPAEGQYTVRVHYFEDNGVLEGTGGGATIATVRIWVRGALEEESSLMLTRNEVWDVGVVRWSYGYVIMDESPEPTNATKRSCPEE